MFEVGRDYRFRSGFAAEQSTWVGEVLDVSLPLIKVRPGWDDQGTEIVLNTTAFDFSSAEIQPYQSPEEKAEARTWWQDNLATPQD